MFITLTHSTGRALLNIDHIIGVVEHEGKVYVSPRVGDAVEVFETYDDIIKRIEDSRGKVW
jgi:hypothetical protein